LIEYAMRLIKSRLMINIKYNTRNVEYLYRQLDLNASKSARQLFFDVKISGNSEVVVKARRQNSFLIFKDIPVFSKYCDWSLVFYHCLVHFSGDRKSVDLKIIVKPYVMIWLLILLVCSFWEYYVHGYSNGFAVFIVFYLLIITCVFSSRKRYKRFILQYLETIGNINEH